MGFPIMVPNYLGILCSILLSYADTLAFYTESSLYRQGAEARGERAEPENTPRPGPQSQGRANHP